jgi:L-Ala-D/L-Glu epimerase
VTARGGGRRPIAARSATHVRVPFRAPFVTGVGTFHERDAWLLHLRAADGVVGIGEASLHPAADQGSLDALAAAMRAAVLDPASAAAAAAGGMDPIALAVRAAVAGAEADLEHGGAPATHGFVPVNATIATETLDETLEATEAALDAGFECLKLKCGGEHTTEGLVERLSLVRALAGDDIELRLDVNGAWDLDTAVERLGTVADLDVSYVEQPIPPGDLERLAWLRRVSPVEIAADEQIGSRADAEAVLIAEAADVLIVKPARVGGPAEALAIAAAAADRGVQVTISNLLETGVGLAAAIRVAAALPDPDGTRAHGLATANVLVDDLLTTPLRVHDGRIAVPGAPLDLHAAALERWTIERVEAPG